MRKKSLRPGPLQLEILKILWERGASSVSEVHEALEPHSRLAYTTVATMLRKMEARGLLRHRTDGRRFLYRAAVAEDEVTRSLVDDVIDRVFEGSLSGMVSHLLATRKVSPNELRELERLIAGRKKRK